MSATSTTYGSSFLFDALVLEAQAMRVLDSDSDPLYVTDLPTGVQLNSATIRHGSRIVELSLYRKEGSTGFSCSVREGDDLLLTIRSPGFCLNGESYPIWEFVAVLECEVPPWLKAACDCAAIPDIYQSNDGPDFLHLIPEAERADPQSKFMECFLMNLLKELAR